MLNVRKSPERPNNHQFRSQRTTCSYSLSPYYLSVGTNTLQFLKLRSYHLGFFIGKENELTSQMFSNL